MNKKRVALALAAALGVNTLMVTVGQVGEQITVAHAQNARLTGEQENLLNTLNFTQLTIKNVETLSDGKTALTFDLNKDDISNVKVSKAFEYKVFEERATIDTTKPSSLPTSGTWNSTTGKFELGGKLDQPGIYAGDITIEYKDGRTAETYTISLRKMPNDTLTLKKVEVTEGAIKIKDGDVELNGKVVDLSQVAATDLVLRTSAGDIKGTYNTTTKEYVFNSGIDFKVGKAYELVYKFGESTEKHEAVAQIVLVAQEVPEVNAYVANDATAGDISQNATFKAAVAKDYGVEETSVAGVSSVTSGQAANQHNEEFKITADGVDVVTYEQTLKSTTVGGAKLALDTSVEGEVKVTVGGAAVTDAVSFVPALELGYGTVSNSTTTLAGNYVMTIGNKSVSYFDAGKDFTSAAASNATDSYFLQLTGNAVTGITVDTANSSVSYPITLEHGYSSVSVNFTVEEGKIAGKTYSQLKEIVENAATTAGGSATPILPTLDPKVAEITGTVKTSLIISKDAINGEVVQAKFEQVAGETNRGKLTLVNGAKLVSGLANNEIPTKFTVKDANGNSGTVTLDSVNNGNIILNVVFNGTFPSQVNWTFANGTTNLNGTLATSGLVEAVNLDGTVGKTNANTNRIDNVFEITAKFNSTVPSGATLKIDQDGGTTDLNYIDYTKFQKGQHTISAIVPKTSKYAGTYSAGVWVQKQDFTVELKSTSATSSSVTLEVVGKDVTTDALKKVNKAYVQYKLSGTTEWKDGVEISKTDAQTKDKKITVTQSGLESGKEYDFRVVYEGTNANDKVYSNIVEKYKTSTSSSSTITGNGSSSTTTGTSTGSTTITVTTSNSTLTGTSASVTLPSGFRYDSGKNPVAVTFKYKDKDGKIVTETKEQHSNVTARFNGNNVELNGLVPGKNYDEITVDYTDNNGRTRSIILRNIQTSTTVESDKYLANVYTVVFDRPADEAGYHFHLDNLKNKKVSLRDFLLNMLSEKEFIEKYKSTEQKVEALYSAIVARSSDEAGKKFWVEEYNKVLKVYGSESTALRAIADRMVNENELKELADKMGVQW